MSSNTYAVIMIAVIAAVTMLIRFLPFILFKDAEKMPKSLKYLGGVLPGAVMGMLVVYCFKSTTVLEFPYALPEIIASAVVVVLYLWRKNTLLSIGLGTVLYMFLVQVVFV